jgi:hypothetical protein
LAAIKNGDYPMGFHLLDATYGKIKPTQKDGSNYYIDMDGSEAALFRTTVNHAWRRERGRMSIDTMEGMTRDGKSLSELDTYLEKSGLVWVRPGMSHRSLATTLIEARGHRAKWEYLLADRKGPCEFRPEESSLNPAGLIANITKRQHPVIHWSTNVTLKATTHISELFGWATIQIKFGRMSQIRQQQAALHFEHVNLHCVVQGIPETDQPTGESFLNQTVSVSLVTGQISLST